MKSVGWGRVEEDGGARVVLGRTAWVGRFLWLADAVSYACVNTAIAI